MSVVQLGSVLLPLIFFVVRQGFLHLLLENFPLSESEALLWGLDRLMVFSFSRTTVLGFVPSADAEIETVGLSGNIFVRCFFGGRGVPFLI